MQAVTLPPHILLEVARRPHLAKRLGVKFNAPPVEPISAPPQVFDRDMRVRQMEAERRPAAARRLGLSPARGFVRAPLQTVPSAETAAYAMEIERRPAAARRVMDSPRRATAALPVPALDDSVVARLEASRRVRAARRLGLFQTLPSDAECVVEAEVPLALPFASTAAAEMERRRRPRAAAGRAPVSSLPAVDAASAASPGAALADTACARSERARRPRAAARADALARLTAPRSILHPELVGAFAAERDAERAFADWRSNCGWTADEKDSLATTSNESLEMDAPEFLKSSASARTPRLETDPFAALERMLETRLRVPERCASSPRAAGGSGTTSRGGSTRGASACSSAFTRAPRSRSSLNGHGSSADLEREGSTRRGNAVPRRVRCSLENADVVCRVDDSDEVVERVARDSVEAKITALAETLERERLSAPPPVSR